MNTQVNKYINSFMPMTHA